MTAPDLRAAIDQRTARVGVIGCGYVGLPLAVSFAKAGLRVIGIDVDAERVRRLCAGESYIQDVPSSVLEAQLQAKRFDATTDYAALRDVDIIFVAVPTPFDRAKQPDLRYILQAAESIAGILQKGQLIVLESTTYPGTTDEVMRPILERSGLRAGTDFYLAFSPERIDPGNKTFGIENTPKVVGGIDAESTALASAILQIVTKGRIHAVSSARVAELTKLLENTFRAVNIALVNELAMLCDRMGIDIWEVIDAAATKPYGFMPFYPGPGVGGHCLLTGEWVIARDSRGCGPRTVEELWQSGEDFEVLGIGVDGPPRWERVTQMFRRPFHGDIVTIATVDGREIAVTGGHPMLVVTESGVHVRHASAVGTGDLLPVVCERLEWSEGGPDPRVDMLLHIGPELERRIRVALRTGSWRPYGDALRRRVGADRAAEMVSNGQLPLALYRAMQAAGEHLPPHDELLLRTGRGRAAAAFPCVITLTPDVARLIGYYATEGCVTSDSITDQIVFTFHEDERETVTDLLAILKTLGIRWSIAKSGEDRNLQVRVSSRLFGLFLRDVLGCGKGSYDAAVPETLLAASIAHRVELLSGLLRGDGSVDVRDGPRTYVKNGRTYTHEDACASVGYWTSSPRLERQFSLLVGSLGIRASIQRRRRQPGADFHLLGAEQQPWLATLFADDKRARLLSCLARKQRTPRSRGTWDIAGQAVAAVERVDVRIATTFVYSIEAELTHTYAAGHQIWLHNCIPVDPYYLAWKAREFDFHTKFIELAAETNLAMPFFTVGRIRKQLNDAGRPLRGSRVLVLGAAFKKDIDDARESAAIRVMEILHSEGALVEYHDPFVPAVKLAAPLFASNGRHETLRSVTLDDERLRAADCVVILVPHSSVDYAKVVREAPRVFDAVNATRGTDRAKVERL